MAQFGNNSRFYENLPLAAKRNNSFALSSPMCCCSSPRSCTSQNLEGLTLSLFFNTRRILRSVIFISLAICANIVSVHCITVTQSWQPCIELFLRVRKTCVSIQCYPTSLESNRMTAYTDYQVILSLSKTQTDL